MGRNRKTPVSTLPKEAQAFQFAMRMVGINWNDETTSAVYRLACLCKDKGGDVTMNEVAKAYAGKD